MFHLTLFGAPSLRGPKGPLDGRPVQRRRIALLAVLALARSGAVTRDRLIGLLWPEAGVERARHLLSDSVYLLRKALGERAILSAGDDLRLDPRVVRCDVAEFGQALEAGEWARAASLYTGPLLEGFFAEDAPEFEHWLEFERERLARGYARALESLAEAASVRGDWEQAVEALRRLSGHDPFSGRVALALMRALDGSGDRAGAIRHAHAHALLLRRELEAEPDPEVEVLAARLRGEPARREEGGAGAPVPTAAASPTALTAVGTNVDTARPLHEETGSRPAPPPFPTTPTSRRSLQLHRLLPGLPPRARWLGGGLALALLAVLAAGGQAPVVLGYLQFRPGGSPPDPLPAGGSEGLAERSIAVLPFVDMSADGDTGYFSDGVTEEIIAVLARVGELRVTSRTSAMRYRKTEKSVPEIARELGVTHVLEGSVRRAGDRLRITVQLIDAHSDGHVWAESYERALSAETLFQIQRDIAQHIADELRAEVSLGERQRLDRSPTLDLAAYDFYLRGRESMRAYTLESLRRAIALFDRALELDPKFALAEAYRGSSYSSLAGLTRRDEYRDSAYASHQRVRSLNPMLPEGHQLAGRHHHSLGHLDEALRLYQRALELDSNHAAALSKLADVHEERGRLDLALPLARKAASLDPLSAPFSWQVFMLYVRLGDREAAEQWLAHMLGIQPVKVVEHTARAVLSLMRGDRERLAHHLEARRKVNSEEPTVLGFLANMALYAGDFEGARRDYERQQSSYPERWHTVLTGLALTYWHAGERQRAEALLQEAVVKAQQRLDDGDQRTAPLIVLAQVHAIRGDHDRAVRHLEAAYARGWRNFYYARLDPRYETLRGHPRFERLMERTRADLDRMRERIRVTERSRG
jgi:TolB-like protein/DNA-binding SARP family transcriptional activator/Flp pilus assembly protein TadD